MSEMEFYSGFAWAVPRAFASALNACRFEQGDVLYSDVSAYDESTRGKRPRGYHIQVLESPRSIRAISGDGEGQRFFANWESPVSFEWMDYRGRECHKRHASQGGLFTCLWRGDLEALRGERQQDLLRPKLLRELQSCVADSISAMVEQFGGAGPAGKSNEQLAAGRRLFATALDQSSDASRLRAQAIERALEAKFKITARRFSLEELDLDDAAQFHPALQLLGIAIDTDTDTDTDAEIERVLRDVLYAGGRAAGKEGGRFQLARHGSLVGLDQFDRVVEFEDQ